ncbi:hypothetical protein ACQP1W_29040 [Spirillospora sp. CA-255316]
MGGYIDRAGGVLDTLDEVSVQVLAFTDAHTRFALAVTDLLGVNEDAVTAVREAMCEDGVDGTWLAATHTHSAPHSGIRPGGGGTTPTWLSAGLQAAVLSATRAAESEARDRTILPLRVWVDGVGGRRSTTKSPEPLPIDCVAVVEGAVIAGLLVVSPVHPTVLDATNRRLSADLNGAVRRRLEERLGCWAVVATGAAGDISTRFARRGATPEEAERLGDLVAIEVQGGLAAHLANVDHPESRHRSSSTLGRIVSERLSLARRDPAELEALLTAADSSAATADRRGIQVLHHGVLLARAALQQENDRPLECTVEAIRLGPVVLVALPVEPYLSVGEMIGADPQTIVLGYTNDYLGYLPDRFTDPTYEVLASPFEPTGAGELITAARRVATMAGDGS